MLKSTEQILKTQARQEYSNGISDAFLGCKPTGSSQAYFEGYSKGLGRQKMGRRYRWILCPACQDLAAAEASNAN